MRKMASPRLAHQNWWRRVSESRYIMPVIFIAVFASLGSATLFLTQADSNARPITGIGGKCLDNSDGARVDGNKIQLYHCNGGSSQNWSVNTDGTISNANGFCLGVSNSTAPTGSPAVLNECNGSIGQRWNVNYTAKTITNSVSSFCLTDSNASLDDGNPIWIEACNDSNAQQWAAPPMTAASSAR